MIIVVAGIARYVFGNKDQLRIPTEPFNQLLMRKAKLTP